MLGHREPPIVCIRFIAGTPPRILVRSLPSYVSSGMAEPPRLTIDKGTGKEPPLP